jgi:hypothetical protein
MRYEDGREASEGLMAPLPKGGAEEDGGTDCHGRGAPS